MASVSSARARPSLGGLDPFRQLFRVLTSVRFAIIQLGLVAVASLLGVLFPQAPEPVRLNPTAFDAWMEMQRERYGVFAEPMRDIRLFEVFHAPWFTVLLALLLISVAVCTTNRFAPTWRAVRRPLRRVNDRYFETAHAKAIFATPADTAAVERVLRKHRFKVEPVAERDGTRYLFADKYAWAQFATFASHLSLILFIAGGIVSKLVGFQTFIQIGEGSTQPVFPVVNDNQMQVLNLDSIEGKDEQGRVIDYRTLLAIYQGGREICRGYTTVNDPLPCNGFRFHQATFTDTGAVLQVKDTRTGQVVLSEAPVLQGSPGSPSPRLRVRNAAGEVVLDDFITLTPATRDTMAQIFGVPDTGELFAVSGPLSGKVSDWQVTLFHAARGNDPSDGTMRATLKPGDRVTGAGYTFEFVEMRANPFNVLQGLPGMERAALVQMAEDASGTLYLDIQNMGNRDAADARVQLEVGKPRVIGDYEYTFGGRRAFTGVLVKRDPGSWFIWVATTLLIGGLMVTFYVPRRRLWVKITPERTYLAGLGERSAHLGEELERLGTEMQQPAGHGARR